jgi:hypothetical protein
MAVIAILTVVIVIVIVVATSHHAEKITVAIVYITPTVVAIIAVALVVAGVGAVVRVRLSVRLGGIPTSVLPHPFHKLLHPVGENKGSNFLHPKHVPVARHIIEYHI